MAFLQNFRKWLGFSGPPASDGDEDLRRQVEAAVDRDDAGALADLLKHRREEGKELIRAYEAELAGAEPDRRDVLTRRLTALVAVYAQAFGDSEPLSWFQKPPDAPPPGPGSAADRARAAFQRGAFEEAETIAAEAIDELPAEGTPERDAAAAPESSLWAIRGGAATERGAFDEAAAHFERSLAPADRSGAPDVRAAAHLNLFDLNSRRNVFEEDDLGETMLEAATGTAFEDVAGKLLVERGLALTRRGSLDAAVRLFDRAVEHRPAWPFPYYQRAWARFLLGDSGGALDDYREVASRTPVFFTVQREIRCLEDVAAGKLPIEAYRSFCLVRDQASQQPDAVETSAARILDRFPDFAPAHLLLAEAHLARGRAADARRCAQETLTHDPDPDTAAAALFLEWNLSRAAGDLEALRAAAERLRSAYPDHPATEIVGRLGEAPDATRSIRWSWSLDGTLKVEDVNPADRTPPPPAPPG